MSVKSWDLKILPQMCSRIHLNGRSVCLPIHVTHILKVTGSYQNQTGKNGLKPTLETHVSTHSHTHCE